MITQTTKIENGTITLPPKLRKAWKEADVLVKGNERQIIIERPNNKIFDSDTEKKLRRLGITITKKDIERAITWARRQRK